MKKYIITSGDVQKIYDAINCGQPQTNSLRIKQLELMLEIREILDKGEISPWEETVRPWEGDR